MDRDRDRDSDTDINKPIFKKIIISNLFYNIYNIT